jgi:hypothetical protein
VAVIVAKRTTDILLLCGPNIPTQLSAMYAWEHFGNKVGSVSTIEGERRRFYGFDHRAPRACHHPLFYWHRWRHLFPEVPNQLNRYRFANMSRTGDTCIVRTPRVCVRKGIKQFLQLKKPKYTSSATAEKKKIVTFIIFFLTTIPKSILFLHSSFTRFILYVPFMTCYTI